MPLEVQYVALSEIEKTLFRDLGTTCTVSQAPQCCTNTLEDNAMQPKKPTYGGGLLTVPEAAKYTRKSKSWLDQGRVYGYGPSFIKLRGSIFYSRDDLDAYIDANRLTSQDSNWDERS